MKTTSFFVLLIIFVSQLSHAQSVTISPIPTSDGNQVLYSDGINTRLNAKLGTSSNASNGNLILQCCGYDNGKVGIGLSSPLATLHIKDDFATNTTLRLSGQSIFSAVKGLEFVVDANGYTNEVSINQLENAPMRFSINNIIRMSVLQTGRVGIGTSNPASTLHLQAPDEQNTTLRFSSKSGALGQVDGLEIGTGPFVSAGSSSYIRNMDPNGYLFYNSNFHVFRSIGNSQVMILRSGNVGIGSGISIPQTKLELEGDIAITRKRTLPSGTQTYNNLDRQGSSVIALATSSTLYSATITGINKGIDGLLLYIYPTSGSQLVLMHENTGSLAENRIITYTASSLTISQNGGCTLIYDGTAQRWRVINVAN